MIKAIFIAPTYHQADYWANQWGYTRQEWSYIPSDWNPGIYGWWRPDLPVFSCGDRLPDDDMWTAMAMRGFTVYDAQSIEAPGNPELSRA